MVIFLYFLMLPTGCFDTPFYRSIPVDVYRVSRVFRFIFDLVLFSLFFFVSMSCTSRSVGSCDQVSWYSFSADGAVTETHTHYKIPWNQVRMVCSRRLER